MPTTNDSRAIKINANNPKTKRPLFLFIAAGGLLIALYVMGCQFALLPGGLCGPGNLQANVPATPTPRPLALATSLPACQANISAQPYEMDCGSVWKQSESAACNADGTVTYVVTYSVRGAAKENIEQQIKNNQKPGSNPPGACQYTRFEPQNGGAYHDVDITCVIPSDSTLTLSKSFAGSTCQVASQQVCPDNYTLVDSLIGDTGNLYCIPNVKMNQENLCPQGQFYNPEGCCSAVPNTDQVLTCGGLTKTADGYQCEYHQINDLILSFESPACAAPAPPRPTATPVSIQPTPQPTAEPTTERTPPPACTPDATGGGCP